MILYSNHAELKIKQRRLKKTQIELTFKEPNFIKSSYDNRKIAERNFGKRNLRVVFVEEKSDIIIVTAHWTEKK